MVIDQVLPDGHGVAPPADGLGDQLAVGLAGARLRRPTRAVSGRGHDGRRTRAGHRSRRRVGGRLRRNGRFCRKRGRPATAPHHHTRGLQVVAGRLPGGPRWPARSAAATTRGVPEPGPDVVCLQPRRCSCRAGTRSSRGVNVSGRYRKWPVFNRPLMAGFGCPPRLSGLRQCGVSRGYHGFRPPG